MLLFLEVCNQTLLLNQIGEKLYGAQRKYVTKSNFFKVDFFNSSWQNKRQSTDEHLDLEIFLPDFSISTKK